MYIRTFPKGDIKGFARWVLVNSDVPDFRPIHVASNLDASARSALLIGRLHRMLALLSKPAVKKMGFTKDMEFAVLVQVAIMDHPNKKEVCSELLIENSTGVEITKRLAKKGFLLEEPDEKDRRSARLSLTEKGKKTLMQGYQQLAPIHKGFLKALDDQQQQQLVMLLSLVNEQQSHIANLLPIA